MSFDPFDDLGDVPVSTGTAAATATLEPPTNNTPVIEPTTPSAAPAATPAKTTRGKKQSILFFDIETIPDFSRAHLFGLPEIPAPAEYMGESEGPTQSELMNPPRLDMNKTATLEDIKGAVAAALSKANGKKLRREIAEACIEIEKKSQKPRKGVIDLFADMVAAIDGEAKMIADAIGANNKAMSLCPEMSRICAIGWAVGDEPIQSLVVGDKSADGTSVVTEVDVLSKFWMLASAASAVCGYNVLGFDLPTIFVRSVMNKIKATKRFDTRKYGSSDILDLMNLRYPNGGMKSLDFLTRTNGIESEVPDVDGSKVFELYTAGEFAKLGQYVRDDVRIAKTYHRMYSGFFW